MSHHHGMAGMLALCLVVGVIGFFVGGVDYLWVALMAGCVGMHLVHTFRRPKAHDQTGQNPHQ